MSNFLTESNPLIKFKVSIFYHHCQHNPSESFQSCDPDEIAKKLREFQTKAIIIVGIYDDEHLKLYREAILKSGLNPLLVRIVDYRWGEAAIKQNMVILENGWTADLAKIEEKGVNISRRDLISGNIKTVKDRVDKPVYIQSMCGYLYRACNLCEATCPYNAIKVDKKSGVSINYEKCTACGICVSACPVSAIQFPSVSQQAIFEIAKLNGDKKISCYKNHDNSIKIPCLAMLSAVDIALLRSNGSITFECPECELSRNLSNFIMTLTDLNNKIGGIEFISPDIKIESKALKEIKIKNDTFFKRSEARKNIASSENLPDIIFDIDINSDMCTLCESCAKWCPTSAISIQRGENKENLIFDPLKCMGCNICINVCPEGSTCGSIPNVPGKKAINIHSMKETNLKQKVIFEDELVRCKVCGTPIGSRKSLNLIKKIMKDKGAECDDEWLERCPKHRAEYSFQKKFGMNAKFKPRRTLGE